MIPAAERAALEALHFNPAPTPDDIWRPSRFDVPQLHERAVREILSGVNRARRDETTTPLGVALLGRAGAGKTHVLGAVRETIQRADGGCFFLVNMINGRTFWESTVQGIIGGLTRDALGVGSQLKTFLRRLVSQLGIPSAETRAAIVGNETLTRDHLDTFITALRRFDAVVGRDCQDTARALNPVRFPGVRPPGHRPGAPHLRTDRAVRPYRLGLHPCRAQPAGGGQ